MKDIVHIGIIGLGGISGAHIPRYLADPRARITAICDIDPEWLAKEKARLDVPWAYTDYRELFANQEVDAVVICLPTWLHPQAAIDALEAGKHVLCEKPMACSAAEARLMEAAAKRTGKKLMISHNQRLGQDIEYLRRLNREGVFGEIYFMRLAWRRPLGMMPSPLSRRPDGTIYNRNAFNEKAKGGGVLRDLGSHLLDLAMYITGFPELDNAYANCYRKFYPELPQSELDKYIFDAEDLATTHIKFKNGLSMELEVSFGSMIEEEVLSTEIYGTKAGASRGSAHGTMEKLGVKIFHYTQNAVTTETVKDFRLPKVTPDGAFITCILENTEPPVTASEGVKGIEILDAIYRSAGF
jgi:predicted dehydrogenase